MMTAAFRWFVGKLSLSRFGYGEWSAIFEHLEDFTQCFDETAELQSHGILSRDG